ncbi:MAG: hypothetical protein NG712_04620 [Omnitrophica bacterium]|nr:hypothetical protein [Candidatus Omnitrophota bacterium]
MKKKTVLILAATLLILALGMQTGFSQEQEIELDARKIMHKLDEVLANQAEILEQFEEIRQELAIIRVRASR